MTAEATWTNWSNRTVHSLDLCLLRRCAFMHSHTTPATAVCVYSISYLDSRGQPTHRHNPPLSPDESSVRGFSVGDGRSQFGPCVEAVVGSP